jgi:hypothetical protein
MTLTTHAVVGAACASLVPSQPLIGFALGFASHFVIDSIPHWNEGHFFMRSMVKNKQDVLQTHIQHGINFLHDIAIVLADSLLGFALATLILFYFFHVPLYIVLLGAFAGQMPDGLQFVYYTMRWHWMEPLQKFHSAIQKESTNPLYLLREAGLIVAVVVLGIFGVFML